MSLIIDANRAGDFSDPFAGHAVEILFRAAKKRLRICVGGRLLRELAKTRLRDLLVEWDRSGVLQRTDNSAVDAEEVKYAKVVNSDDPHILALARISGSRCLYTADKALIGDFKDVKLLQPKGKVLTPDTSENIVLALLVAHAK